MSGLEAGSVVTGEVVAIKAFGAFVKLETGETGLVHISQISNKYIEKVEDALKVGDSVKVKILSADQSGKISLSIKALEAPKPTAPSSPRGERGGSDRRQGRKSANATDFEGMMKKWLKSSEERLSALAAKQKKNR